MTILIGRRQKMSIADEAELLGKVKDKDLKAWITSHLKHRLAHEVAQKWPWRQLRVEKWALSLLASLASLIAYAVVAVVSYEASNCLVTLALCVLGGCAVVFAVVALISLMRMKLTGTKPSDLRCPYCDESYVVSSDKTSEAIPAPG